MFESFLYADYSLSLGVDKILHGLISFFIVLSITDFLHKGMRGACSLGVCALLALILLLPISVSKEVYDSYSPNNFFDIIDIAANYSGGLIAAFMAAGASGKVAH